MKLIKKAFCVMFCILDSMGRARAAGVLVRQGQTEAAKHIMLGSGECKC
jgi:hypothetical protein